MLEGTVFFLLAQLSKTEIRNKSEVNTSMAECSAENKVR